MKRYINSNRRKSVKASAMGVDGYAVQVRDMGKGYIHLLVYDTEEEAKNAYEDLYLLEWDAVTDDEYDMRVEYATNAAKDIISEIDWRRDIDKDNIYNYDDGRIQIINDVSIDLYLYW